MLVTCSNLVFFMKSGSKFQFYMLVCFSDAFKYCMLRGENVQNFPVPLDSINVNNCRLRVKVFVVVKVHVICHDTL